MLEAIKQVYFLMQIVCSQCCVLIFKGFYILGITVLCIDVSLSDFIFMCGRNWVGEVCCKATHPCRGLEAYSPTKIWNPLRRDSQHSDTYLGKFFKASHWCKSKFENSYFMSLIPVPKVAGEKWSDRWAVSTTYRLQTTTLCC